MTHSRLVGIRLKLLRNKHGYTQQELADALTKRLGKNKPMASMTISSWECGRKLPPAETMIELAGFYGVSVDYILGKDTESSVDAAIHTRDHLDHECEIPMEHLKLYDGEPVYIVSVHGDIDSQWGIVDYPAQCIRLRDRSISINSGLHYYNSRRQSDVSMRHQLRYTISLDDLYKGLYQHVYVKSLSPDTRLRGAIDGWYSVDTDHDMLINQSGRALALDGLAVNYNVFSLQT